MKILKLKYANIFGLRTNRTGRLLVTLVVPIDAKFPRDDYMRYIETEETGEKANHWKAFEQAVRRQIASIATKYIKPERGTCEFALMFIPSEAIYYETIAETNHLGEPSALLEYAQDQHVIPVSPNTFYAFLQLVILSIRNVEIVKSARELQEGLSALHRRMWDWCVVRWSSLARDRISRHDDLCDIDSGSCRVFNEHRYIHYWHCIWIYSWVVGTVKVKQHERWPKGRRRRNDKK